MTLGNCTSKGLIKEHSNAINRVDKELLSANKFLNSSRNIMGIEEYDLVFLSSYNSCFHFFRALLYKKGFVEKSHYCLIVALKEIFSSDSELQKLLNDFDKLRMSRHEIQYGGIFSDKAEAEYILEFNEKLKIYVHEAFSS